MAADIQFNQSVYLVVRLIPEGKVATYGQIARLVGMPRHARHVGHALAALDYDNDVPWHRVINSKGALSRPDFSREHNHQRVLLEEEGVEFSISGKVLLKKYQWSE